ncbi:MAG: zinc ribbon domain-containing protein [Treponemataceae bacterium]|nr:zinc ribbon domain-containing protein [Treponemataceae bacterium]
MKCSSCGTEIEGGAAQCPNCGADGDFGTTIRRRNIPPARAASSPLPLHKSCVSVILDALTGLPERGGEHYGKHYR